MKELTTQQRYSIAQVAATMAIEDMELDERAHESLVQLATRQKTADELISEIKKEYANG